jgi:hypothetical protein
MKKIRENEIIGAIIHIYMKISQSFSLCSYLYLTPKKCNCFLILFYKLREQNVETCPLCVGSVQLAPVGMGEVSWKRCSSVNTVQKYVHMYVNEKMIAIKTRSWGRWSEEL